ncbi:MAG TPA: DNA polymerase III subunit delta [Burkholderiaceae bacterium]|nr:DNA polymerase III subunit delta [Burkholderiaceae bacterium]
MLRGEALAPHLAASLGKGRLAPLYVVASSEPLLQIEACDAIRDAARQAGYSERTVLTVTNARFDWSQLTAASTSFSLFAERRIVELRIPTGKPGKEGSAALQALAASAANATDDDATLTLVALPRPDGEMKRAAWFEPLQSAAVFVQIESVERNALPAWIAERLARQQQSAPREALAFIADRVEGNLLAAHQEIRKLGLLYPARALTLDEVRDAVLDVARYDVFKLGEALLVGDAARFARMLEGLQGEGEPVQLATWAIAEELRTLWRVKHASTGGKPVNAVLKELRVWGPRERLLPNAVARLSSTQIARAIERCAALDKSSKGLSSAARDVGAIGEPWADLLALGLTLCETRRG